MSRLTWIIAIGSVMVAGALFWSLAESQSDPTELALGPALYAFHCAGCHGVNLEGQPEWEIPLPDGRMRAPPLNWSGHAHHHSQAELFRIVKEGMAAVNSGKPTDMPPFEGVLTDEDIQTVLAFIQSTW